jgi:hypothetical protein
MAHATRRHGRSTVPAGQSRLLPGLRRHVEPVDIWCRDGGHAACNSSLGSKDKTKVWTRDSYAVRCQSADTRKKVKIGGLGRPESRAGSGHTRAASQPSRADSSPIRARAMALTALTPPQLLRDPKRYEMVCRRRPTYHIEAVGVCEADGELQTGSCADWRPVGDDQVMFEGSGDVGGVGDMRCQRRRRLTLPAWLRRESPADLDRK